MTTCVKHLHGKYGIESADPALQIAHCQINWGFLEIFGKKKDFCDVIKWYHNFSNIYRAAKFSLLVRHNQAKSGQDPKSGSAFSVSKWLFTIIIFYQQVFLENLYFGCLCVTFFLQEIQRCKLTRQAIEKPMKFSIAKTTLSTYLNFV